MSHRCKGRKRDNSICTRQVTGRRKYCFQHSRKPKKRSRRKNRKNPSLAGIRRIYAKLDRELKRLCTKYSCAPVECEGVCNPPPVYRRRNPWPRPFSRLARRGRDWLRRGAQEVRRRGERLFQRDIEEEESLYPFAPIGDVEAAYLEPSLPHEEEPLPLHEEMYLEPRLQEEMYLEPSLPPEPSRRPILRNILIVGGDEGYIPNWLDQFGIMQIDRVIIDLEQQLGAFRPDLILMFVKAEKPHRPTKHTIYKIKAYANGNNSENRKVPYITIHKGWSHAVQRATELGVDWFVDAYPWQPYVPEEDLAPKPKKRLTKAKLAHHAKRAARFYERGITGKDIIYAQARYITEEPSKCSLCDTKLKYQFRLLFDRPSEPEPVIFFPVGSVCITDWMDAIPDSKGKLAFCARLKKEMEKIEAIQNEKRKVSAAKAKEKRKAAGIIRKQREKERRAKIAARKKAKKKATKKKTVKKKTIKTKKKLKKRMEKKFEDTQKMFGWVDEPSLEDEPEDESEVFLVEDEPEPLTKKQKLEKLFELIDDDSTDDDW